ncbi:DUF1906 domain-containing protein [Actinomadura parmotrematis]|uniref:DUF1906 domain-containing protein n=1 Tax=Actinomadura parmotrematis TaxID=2864039 RepID=A0ABS7FU81_9ACTN|nr:DUF1906 domain-containing protein [Actinomadura parmotrematis]MBW8483510.1 DUF1906 domain-containing protein [Actinomadura parmotrematis]
MPAARSAPGPDAAADPSAARTVAYRGVRVPVPAGWPVYRLDEDPARCVRFDVHAVYLGRPSAQPDCPARAVGRTEALLVEPRDDDAARRRGPVRADRLAHQEVAAADGREVAVAVPEAGVTMTGTYGADPGALRSVVQGTRLSADWAPEPGRRRRARVAPVAPPELPALPAAQRVWATGKGFDTCTAPSLRAMRAWRGTYGVGNIYIGGAARGCAQPNLTASWVRSVRAMGYRLIPTYVGLQSPCTPYRAHFDAANAPAEGAKAARDAVARARALGIPRGKPIYFDMEAYDSGRASCRKPVLAFLQAWSTELVRRRYVPGVYSSVASGVRDLGRARGVVKPDAIWFASWDGAATSTHRMVRDDWWQPHRRIKQYRGGHRETHGGVTLNVDSNYVDGRVY